MTQQNDTTEPILGNIRAEMARANITATRIAEALDVTQASASRKIHGSQPITLDELLVIADCLNTTPAHLMRADA